MADLFSVTAPLAIRFKDGRRQVMIERAPHRGGLLFLPPFWITLGLDKSLVFAAGPVRGEGPWKVGDAVVTVLACHGGDPALASEFADWQLYLQQAGSAYPERDEIRRLMLAHAAVLDGDGV
jgi:hypothetical protein